MVQKLWHCGRPARHAAIVIARPRWKRGEFVYALVDLRKGHSLGEDDFTAL